MKKVLFFVFVAVLAACGGKKKDGSAEAVKNDKPFAVDTIYVDDSTNFPYQYDSVSIILEKVKLCKIMDTINEDTTVPPCDHRLMRYFANNNQPTANGFIVEIKPRVWSKWFLVVCIAKNKDGDYYKANAYHGELLELRTTKKGPYDIVIRYVDLEVGTVAVLHKWNKTKYDPVEVIEINDHYVKPEWKDSLNNAYLKNFVWGY